MSSPESGFNAMIDVQANMLTSTTCDDARVQAMCAYHAEVKEKLDHKFECSEGGHPASYQALLRARKENRVKAKEQALLRAENRKNRN